MVLAGLDVTCHFTRGSSQVHFNDLRLADALGASLSERADRGANQETFPEREEVPRDRIRNVIVKIRELCWT